MGRGTTFGLSICLSRVLHEFTHSVWTRKVITNMKKKEENRYHEKKESRFLSCLH